MATLKQENQARSGRLPEHGPMAENGREILLSLKNVDITFGKGDDAVRAVQDASFDIYKGETFSLVGESGSGKTTIGRAITRINPVSAGEILFKGRRISGKISKELDLEVIKKCQMIFQDPMTALNPLVKIGKQLEEVILRHSSCSKAEAREKAVEMLRKVGIPMPEQRLKQYPHEFSGGMRQRVLIAMALACEPKLLIADEPTTALDVTIQLQIVKLLQRLNKEKKMAVLFISHDLSLVKRLWDRIIVKQNGDIVEQGSAQAIFECPKERYTKELIEAIPRLEKLV